MKILIRKLETASKMPEPTNEELRKGIASILKDANLGQITSRMVRLQLEVNFLCDLLPRLLEVDNLIMELVNARKTTEAEKTITSEKGNRTAMVDCGAPPSKIRKVSVPVEPQSEEVQSSAGSKSNSLEDCKKSMPIKSGMKSRLCKLSSELAAICGADMLPRQDVITKVWAFIKDRNLYDPKNGQYVICDSELQKVIGVKRFRTFGMLKYLKPHFLS